MHGVSEHHSYKRHVIEEYGRMLSFRSFAGINTFLIGDFYQLPPVGGTAIMGNPYSDTVLENESVQNIVSRIWHCADEADNPNAIQLWSEIPGRSNSRIFSFEINQRSGKDTWFKPIESRI